MTEHTFQFGTDGWRAVVGEGFTLENVRIVAAATACWMHDTFGDEATAVIGYDPRRLGEEAARVTARALAARGVHVYFADDVTTTPAVSWATKKYACNAGVVITASHNPAAYNGFKVKGHYGGSSLPEMIREIERRLPEAVREAGDFPTFESLADRGLIDVKGVRMSYQRMLSEQFDLDGIRAAGIRVVHDAMYGAGQGVLLDLLGPDHVLELHPDPDPDFGGTPPEPIERNLTEMRATVKGLGYAAGIANDGDADRIGMCDEEGRFVDSHRLLALLLRYLHEDLGMSGEVVKTVSTTDMIDVMGRAYGLTVHTTPIGFKHISGLFLERDVLIGGEESGGIAVKGHVPDRDGIYVGIMILEMMASHGKSLSELVEELYAEFGRYDYHREDLHTTDTAMERVLDRLQSAGGLTEIAGRAVLDVDRLDGYKHRMKNGWLLIRPSGTEPVLRIYSESRDAALAEASVRDAIRQLALHSA